jgi:hypothetical protein
MLKVATLPETAPEPILVTPSKKSTVPVGVPDAVEIVVVRVTFCPAVDGFTDDINDTLVDAFTTWVNIDDVLEALFASPLYVTVILCEPADNNEVFKVATLPERLTVPRLVNPSKKSMLPVGVDPVTVAVKVTLCPVADGFTEDVSDTPEEAVTDCDKIVDVLVA